MNQFSGKIIIQQNSVKTTAQVSYITPSLAPHGVVWTDGGRDLTHHCGSSMIRPCTSEYAHRARASHSLLDACRSAGSADTWSAKKSLLTMNPPDSLAYWITNLCTAR